MSQWVPYRTDVKPRWRYQRFVWIEATQIPPLAGRAPMLQEFLHTHRAPLIELCRQKVLVRRAPQANDVTMEHGIPLFLDQVIRTLRLEQTADPMQSRAVSGPANGIHTRTSEIGGTAAQHGLELWQQGFTIDQVVHDYGDLCQAVTEAAFAEGASIPSVKRCSTPTPWAAASVRDHACRVGVGQRPREETAGSTDEGQRTRCAMGI